MRFAQMITISFCLWSGLFTTALAEESLCRHGNLSCLHEPVGSSCGMGTCLPTGRAIGGDFICDCKSGGVGSREPRCSSGALSCLHKEIGSSCGLGTCLDTGHYAGGYACACKGGDVTSPNPPRSSPRPAPVPPKPAWSFCDPKDSRTSGCTKVPMATYEEGQKFLALFCGRPREISLVVGTRGKKLGLQNFVMEIAVDGNSLQSRPAIEDQAETDVLYKADLIATETLSALKTGGRMSVSISSSEKALRSMSFQLRGSGAAIGRLEAVCK